MALSTDSLLSPVEPLKAPFDREGLEDIGYMTCMTLVLLGNYAQTGHFGGPLAYTPFNVAAHLAGPELADCAMITGAPNTHSATNSCWREATTFPPATRFG